ncbi:hypothetical protein DI09_13p340 [Mitosporidium daphniae]|uniref:DNA replication complex GINS protein SLD5 n=1 Tax=Mitosporidium daphniae TaxID=1485682 RepID=A0A098VUX6_9MICR|nr:uncharacterized protein DI09_13p340 [Mitosporidium daphniae]KGG52745.1 hypothetical protein DI09_13p340 [Mitosporidium daphniae]|eukprot:XP_013239172.1 uncharacterized protein DI09_13p340 [Mitosporidium daphniae]
MDQIGISDSHCDALVSQPEQDELPAQTHSLLEALENALFNERSSPLILPPFTPLLEEIKEAIEFQERSFESVENFSSNIEAYMNTIKLMDLERVKYLSRSYIEIRIAKLNVQLYNITPSKSESCLMPHEKIHLENIRKSTDKFLIEKLYSHFPEPIKKRLISDDCQVIDNGLVSGSMPQINGHVTCLILEDIGEYMIDPILMLSVSCKKGDIFRMPFKSALQLVLKSSARLI